MPDSPYLSNDPKTITDAALDPNQRDPRLPPVLPSLTKPLNLMPPVSQNQPGSFANATPPQPPPMNMRPASNSLGSITPTALPPVKALDPTPAEKAVDDARSTLAADRAKPSFTAGLWDKARDYHDAHPGFIGRLGQVGAGLLRGVDIAGEMLAPNVAKNIPGSGLYKSAQEARDQAKLTAAEAGAKTEAETAKDKAEAAKASAEAQNVGVAKPKEEEWEPLMSNGQPVTDKDGHVMMHEKNSGQIRPSDQGGIIPPVKPGSEPLSAQEAKELNEAWNPALGKLKGQQLNRFTPNMPRDQAKMIETALNAATGRQQGDIRISLSEQGLADKEQKAREAAAQNVTQSRTNLYILRNYQESMKDWHAKVSGAQYAKDVALIGTLVGDQNEMQRSLGGTFGATPLPLIFGGANPLTAIAGGAGLNILQSVLAGPITATMTALSKQGLSHEGYQAMAAYFNALPARMALEITAQGLKASQMRFGQLINKAMQAVPPPNTPAGEFPGAWQKNFAPIQANVEANEKTQNVPAGFQPPTYEGIYGGGEAQSFKVGKDYYNNIPADQVEAFKKKYPNAVPQ